MKRFWYFPSAASHTIPLAVQIRQNLNAVPVVWSGDPRLNVSVRDLFPETMVLDVMQAMRGDLSVGEISPSAFDIYCKYISSEQFKIDEPLLLAEFNRLPHDYIFSNPDSSVVLRELLMLIIQIIEDKQPDFLLASETPHNPFYLAAFFFFSWRKIPTLYFQPAWTLGPLLLPRTGLDEPLLLEQQSDSSRTVDDFLELTWKSIAESLIGGETTPLQKYERLRTRRLARDVTELKKSLIVARNLFRSVLKGKALHELLIWVRRRRLLQSYNSLTELNVTGPYGLFALHYQPERTSIPEGALLPQQLDVVALARRFLPAAMNLAVKEHENQVAPQLFGYQARSPKFYRAVNSMPDTLCFRGRSETRDLIVGSTVVFTMTGSIGIQAALLGVPCVYFGNPWWAGLPGTFKYTPDLEFERVAAAAAVSTESLIAILGGLVRDRLVPGWGTPSQEVVWRESLNLPKHFDEESIRCQLDVVRRFIEEFASRNTVEQAPR